VGGLKLLEQHAAQRGWRRRLSGGDSEHGGKNEWAHEVSLV
jgi:hypothetical protein